MDGLYCLDATDLKLSQFIMNHILQSKSATFLTKSTRKGKHKQNNFKEHNMYMCKVKHKPDLYEFGSQAHHCATVSQMTTEIMLPGVGLYPPSGQRPQKKCGES